MTYCSQCELVHGEEHRFCQRCGQLLVQLSETHARPCARCGADTAAGQKFCTDCGLPLRAMAPAKEEDRPRPKAPLFYPRSPEPRAPRRRRRPGRALTVLVVFLAALGGIYAFRALFKGSDAPRPPVVVSPQEDLRREVERLAEKIRAAHLAKDINKWLSSYSPAYPELGRVESQVLELWKSFDVKEVSYRISNVERLGDRQASAVIVWNIQLYDQRTHDYNLQRPAYKITLEKANGGWKIRDSKEEAAP